MDYIQLKKKSDFQPQSGMEYCCVIRTRRKPLDESSGNLLHRLKKALNLTQTGDPLRSSDGWNPQGTWFMVNVHYFDRENEGDRTVHTRFTHEKHDQLVRAVLEEGYELAALHHKSLADTLYFSRAHQGNPKNIPAPKKPSSDRLTQEPGWDYCVIHGERSYGKTPWIWTSVRISFFDIDGTHDRSEQSMTREEFVAFTKKLSDEGWITAKPATSYRELVSQYYKRPKAVSDAPPAAEA